MKNKKCPIIFKETSAMYSSITLFLGRGQGERFISNKNKI
jgi:hypothetical protein